MNFNPAIQIFYQRGRGLFGEKGRESEVKTEKKVVGGKRVGRGETFEEAKCLIELYVSDNLDIAHPSSR